MVLILAGTTSIIYFQLRPWGANLFVDIRDDVWLSQKHMFRYFYIQK